MHYRISFIFVTFICLFGFVLAGRAQDANTDESSKPVILYSGTPKKYEIADIKVEGVKNYEDYVLIGLSGLSVGQTISVPGDEITSAIKRYWRHGLFSNVQITAEKIEGNKIWLKISLTQRPRISEIRYHGVKKSERQDLETRLGLVKGSQITPNLVDRAKTLIKRYFDDKGFKNAEIIISQKDDVSNENQVIVDVNIDKKENQSKKVDKKKLENIFNFKIKDNMICIGNRYSNIIRLGNIDYNMLSVSEQDSIENILIQTSLSIDYPVQFFSTTEYIDTSKVIQLMKKNKNTNEKIEEYKNYLIDYLQNLMENRTISVVRSYAIISYDGTSQDAIQELNRKSLSFTSSLLRAKIVCEILTEDEIYNLIYKELNKNSTINISNLQGGGKNLYVGKKQKAKRNKHI